MAKKALCVGINHYPMPDADLRGCVNDAKAWAALLVDRFDFASGDVKMIRDAEATKANILKGLRRLLAGSHRGDILVFSNSSHGSYVPDVSGDERDGYDEVLCPYDVEDAPLLDDELWEILAEIPSGVRMTVVSDSCHSGNITRVMPAEILPGVHFKDQRRPRFLSPLVFRKSNVMRDLPTPVLADALRAKPKRLKSRLQSDMRHVLLSGCKDTEVSYDAKFDVFRGAMSHHALKAIKGARYRITYGQLATRLQGLLDKAGYPQHPQLEGPSAMKRRQIFT